MTERRKESNRRIIVKNSRFIPFYMMKAEKQEIKNEASNTKETFNSLPNIDELFKFLRVNLKNR